MSINTNTIQSLLLPKVWSLLKNSPLRRRQIKNLLTLESTGYSDDELDYVKVIIKSGITRHLAILGWVITNMEMAGIIKQPGEKGSAYYLTNPTDGCPDFETYKKLRKEAWRQTVTKKYDTPQTINTVTTVFVAIEPTKFRNLTTPQIEALARHHYGDYYQDMKFHNSGYLPLTDGDHCFAVFSAQPRS